MPSSASTSAGEAPWPSSIRRRGQRLPDIDLPRAVGTLPPKQRAAVALHCLEDQPVDQVVELMQVAPATVRQHLFKARSRRAECLGETLEEVVGNANR